ncbi:MAG: hypothetical protein K1X83_02735 [Oligoflexia bacterium]|nr:hypothetical protein [Oligoflexia bacterium]
MKQQNQLARRDPDGNEVSKRGPASSVFISADRSELDTAAFETRPAEIETKPEVKKAANLLMRFGRRVMDLSGADKFTVGLYALNTVLQGTAAVLEIGTRPGEAIFRASLALIWGLLTVSRIYVPFYPKKKR